MKSVFYLFDNNLQEMDSFLVLVFAESIYLDFLLNHMKHTENQLPQQSTYYSKGFSLASYNLFNSSLFPASLF